MLNRDWTKIHERVFLNLRKNFQVEFMEFGPGVKTFINRQCQEFAMFLNCDKSRFSKLEILAHTCKLNVFSFLSNQRLCIFVSL